MKRRNFFSTLSLAAIVATGATLAGCSKQQPAAGAGSSAAASAATANADVIKIGVFEPLTGANGAGGNDELEGIKLANKLYPTILGKKVELVVVDNKSDKVEAAKAIAAIRASGGTAVWAHPLGGEGERRGVLQALFGQHPGVAPGQRQDDKCDGW